MLIWPFIAITGILLSLLSYVVFSIEKDVIMRNWDKRRCDVPVMFSASYLKPQSDPRSTSEFASENFSFCMKRKVTNVMEMIMAPFMILLGSQMNVTGSIGNGLQIIRNIVSQVYKAFLSFLQPFYQRFVLTAYQVMAITQRLNMAYRRINTIALAFIYSGLTIVRGMLNVKDFIIKIVLIILGIMVALIVILFFVLAPFIGTIIIPVLGVISAAVGGAAVGGMADAFCFAPDTPIQLENGNIIPISSVRPGNILKEGGCVQAVIETVGNGVELFDINGDIVSSYHIVWDNIRNTWCFAKDHTNSRKSNNSYEKLFCLTTEKRKFITKNGLIARDWEELLDTDELGNMYYEALIKSIINCDTAQYNSDAKNHGEAVPTSQYFYKVLNQRKTEKDAATVLVQTIKTGDIIYDSENTFTKVIGVAKVEKPKEYDWVLDGDSFIKKPLKYTMLTIPLTESGRISLFSKTGMYEQTIMDFTEVGSDKLSKTYDFILSRLLLE